MVSKLRSIFNIKEETETSPSMEALHNTSIPLDDDSEPEESIIDEESKQARVPKVF